MIAFFLEDFREWRLTQMSRTIALSVIALLAVGAASSLQPVFVVMTATVVSILLGWSRCNQYGISSDSRRRLLSCPVPPGAVVAGKLLSSLAIWLAHLLVLSPALALTIAVRGLRVDAIAACACSWLVAYFLSLGLSLLAGILWARNDGLVGLLLVGTWIGATALARPVARANPFIQAWDFLKASAFAGDWAWIGASAVFASALCLASGLALSRIRRSIDA